MNRSDPAHPAQMPQPHVCFSNSAWCSGCNPCEECKYHQKACVLPVAMKAGEGTAPPCACCGEPQIGGLANNAEQANAFWAGWDQGWQRLHDAMMRDENLRQHFVANVVTARVPAAEYLANLQKPQEPAPPVPAPQQAPAPAVAEASAGGVAVDGIDLTKPIDLDVMKSLLSEAEQKATASAVDLDVMKSLLSEAEQKATASAVQVEVVNQRVRREATPKPTPPVRSMSPEEIAQAMTPVPSGPSNGVR